MPDVNFVREILWKGIEAQKHRGKAESSLEADKTDAGQLEHLFKGSFITDDPFCKKRDILDVEKVLHVVDLLRLSLKDSTIRRRMSVASQAIKTMKKMKVRYRKLNNPFAEAVELIDWNITPRTVKVSREEFAEYVLAAPKPLDDMISLSANTGLRRGEILYLTWDRIIEDQVTFIKGAVTKDGGQKNKSTMPCLLNKEAIKIIQRQPRTSIFVFDLGNGKVDKFKNLWKKLNRTLEKQKTVKNITFHDFRSMFGFAASEAEGVFMKDVQSALRHKTMKPTETVYATPDSHTRAIRAARAVDFSPHTDNVVPKGNG